MILQWILVWLSGMAVAGTDSADLLKLAGAQGIKQAGSGSESVFLYTFTRQQQRRATLVLTPGTAFETEITGPSLRCVSVLAGMPFDLGDGAVLKIAIQDGDRVREAVQLSIDPVHIRAHRAWLPVRMEIPAGLDHFRLRFEVTAGPRGDAIGDWVGVAAGHESGCLFGNHPASLKRRGV